MDKKAQINIEEAFKLIVTIIVFAMLTSAFSNIDTNIGWLASFLIGITIAMVVFAFILKILKEVDIIP